MRNRAGSVALALALLAAAPSARAHFELESPASWMSQDALGGPQLLSAQPCR